MSTNQQREGIEFTENGLFTRDDMNICIQLDEIMTRERIQELSEQLNKYIKETLATGRERVLQEVKEEINDMQSEEPSNYPKEQDVVYAILEKVLALITKLKNK